MKESLPTDLAEFLKELGCALDIERPVSVHDGGRVGFNDVEDEKVIENVERQTWGPRTSRWRSRTSRRRRSRGEWPSAETHHFRSGAIEETYGAGFRVLVQHYEALSFEDQHGLWVVVTSFPLGYRGPSVYFLVGLPLDQRISPRAWAFNHIGPKVQPVSLRHTNFPDASICAFTTADYAWRPDDGILPLIDHYSTWTIKKWHFELFGWWPGPQAGACAYYRHIESVAREWCGCQSGKRYGECHLTADCLMSESIAKAEFRRLFRCNYEDRAVPQCILNAARTRWKELPSLALAYAFRQADEPVIPLI